MEPLLLCRLRYTSLSSLHKALLDKTDTLQSSFLTHQSWSRKLFTAGSTVNTTAGSLSCTATSDLSVIRSTRERRQIPEQLEI
ncbi:hypothetical protein J1614_001927 [Plenodomus biglobosus]|nr:hypothetical protein J1614_001927 [Plenodomus biglobosus]